MSEAQTTERIWAKVDWKAGDKITIELTESQAIALNYQHAWLVSLDNANIIYPQNVHVR